MPDLFENLVNKYRQYYHIHHYDGASQVNTGRYMSYLVTSGHEQDRNHQPITVLDAVTQRSLSLDAMDPDAMPGFAVSAESASRKSSVGSLDSDI